MSAVELIWITPGAEALIAYMARVSNPANQQNPEIAKLIRYMIEHKHWSPFEMVSACVEVNTTRDIGRQMLRHKSFAWQEFSQRYAEVEINEPAYRACRLQDTQNRQNSIPTTDHSLCEWWANAQHDVFCESMSRYEEALKRGIAKEQARALLPEGLTPSRMYMAGTLRSFIHYFQVRCSPETQAEHREVALALRDVLSTQLPIVAEACGWTK